MSKILVENKRPLPLHSVSKTGFGKSQKIFESWEAIAHYSDGDQSNK